MAAVLQLAVGPYTTQLDVTAAAGIAMATHSRSRQHDPLQRAAIDSSDVGERSASQARGSRSVYHPVLELLRGNGRGDLGLVRLVVGQVLPRAAAHVGAEEPPVRGGVRFEVSPGLRRRATSWLRKDSSAEIREVEGILVGPGTARAPVDVKGELFLDGLVEEGRRLNFLHEDPMCW